MATTVAQLETKLNAAITRYDQWVNNLNTSIEAIKVSIQAQSERDADNARNLLNQCSEIAKTARDTIANLTGIVDTLDANYSMLLSRITNLENSFVPGTPEPDIDVTGEEINLLKQASMLKLAYINNDPAKIALFGEILVQLKMKLDELIPTTVPELPPKNPDGTQS